MKLTTALLTLLVAASPALADTVDLGPHGTLSLSVPKGWRLTSAKQADVGVTLQLIPQGDVNAQALLTVVFTEKGDASTKEDIDEKALTAGDNFVDQSVEKKKVLKHFSLSGGAYGSYCYFTDASLVGAQPKKGDFKGVASGIIRFNDEVSAGVTLLTDDEKGEDFGAMLAAVSSAKVSAK
jgi:hypothetical protein